MRVTVLLTFGVGFQIAACGGAEEPRVIVEKECVPVPADASTSSNTPTTTAAAATAAGEGTGMPTSLNDPAARAWCDARVSTAGTFYGTGELNFVEGANAVTAGTQFPETKTFDGHYATTISFQMNSYGARWIDDVHGQSLTSQYWFAAISTLPYAAPRTDTFVVGKPESVVIGFGVPMQLVCAEDGTNAEGGGGDDDDDNPPATSLTITKRTSTELAGTVTRGTDTLVFDVALSDDGVPKVCCLGDP